MDVKVKTALISVSDKEGVVEFAKALTEMGVKIISTGGTARMLGSAGVEVIGIEEVTGFPEMMDGRVKTL
ncbi:MAG: IMP cyclohydrolase, partial [Planctomycetota bacterium]